MLRGKKRVNMYEETGENDCHSGIFETEFYFNLNFPTIQIGRPPLEFE